MSIYKKGQKVRLRSEKTAIVQTEAEMLPEGKSKIEYYWVLLEENKQKLHIKGIDILGAIDPVNYSNKIMEVAKKKLTTAVWYTWGLDEYQQQWVDAAKQRELLEHAVKIPKAFDNLVGPGLYLAQQMMSSSVYAKEGATVLIVELKKVPTINSKDKPQMAALAEGVPSVKYEDLVVEKRHSKPEE